MNSNHFESLIQNLSSKINLLKVADESNRSVILNDLVQSINNISENSKNHGIPPPHDDLSIYSQSFLSQNESQSSSEEEKINQLENIDQIKTCNADMKTSIKQTINVFQSASKEFFSSSGQSNRTSIILNELDNLKRNIAEVLEESRSRSMMSSFMDDQTDARELKEVYEQISRIQDEISQANNKLIESEQEILRTDRENFNLKEQLKSLEVNLNHVLITEEEEFKKPSCGCVLV
jgi:hypothetical protein